LGPPARAGTLDAGDDRDGAGPPGHRRVRGRRAPGGGAERAARGADGARRDPGDRPLRVPLRRRRARAGPELHRRPRAGAGVPRRQASGPAAPREARLRQRRPGDDRRRHPRRRARRRVRGARRAARRRRLGGAPARQAVRALDLGGRRAHGAGWLRHRRRPPLPRAAPGGPRMTPSPREGAARGGRTLLSVLVGGAFVALVFLLAWAVVRSDRPDREVLPSPLVGRPAPEFSLPVLHDDAYRVGSADLRGQPYLLNVWGSWCPG